MEERFIGPLLDWYEVIKRDLPWRRTGDAYSIWVSEIMLQQTRVDTVIPYYLRFMQELPDMKALAECEEERLLKLWEGLGYYSRVRNMQAAARTVMESYGGRLPESPKELLKLKGIGSYTAGAVASIAYSRPAAAVDGNVLRVCMRLKGCYDDITLPAVKKQVEEELNQIIPRSVPGIFNQAMMELGALVCIPGSGARCTECPVKEFCKAYEMNIAAELPVKAPKKARRIQKKTVLILRSEEGTAVHKRAGKGLLAGLYELPNMDSELSAEQIQELFRSNGAEPISVVPIGNAKHIFSHIEWHMNGYEVRLKAFPEIFKRRDQKIRGLSELPFIPLQVVKTDILREEYAIPSAFAAYLPWAYGERSGI